MKPKKLDELCVKLQELQRARSVCMKSRIMLANRLQAIVAGTLGYYSGMAEKERASTMKKATQFIADVVGGDVESNLADMIRVHQDGIDTLTRQEKAYEKSMIAITKQLPIMDWVEHQNQRGFGPMFLAIVIGETGNLSNYAINSNLQMVMYRYLDHDTNEYVDKAILIADGKLLDANSVVIIKKGA